MGYYKHGMEGSPTYRSWDSMKQRCLNKKSKDYPQYGGKGIKICQGWIDSFEQFLSDMGTRPEGTSIDRINGSGNYEPGNCRWATYSEQNRNLKSNVILEISGEKKTIAEWAQSTNIPYATIYARYRKGIMGNELIARGDR